jgi:hypothetical protein
LAPVRLRLNWPPSGLSVRQLSRQLPTLSFRLVSRTFHVAFRATAAAAAKQRLPLWPRVEQAAVARLSESPRHATRLGMGRVTVFVP